MSYRLTATWPVHVQTGDFVNPDTNAAYLEWLAAGNEPAPITPDVVQVPAAVTMRQARLALLAAGKLGQVSTAIASLPSPQKEAAQIEWEYAATVERTSTLTELLAASLSLTEVQVDALFLQAATL